MDQTDLVDAVDLPISVVLLLPFGARERKVFELSLMAVSVRPCSRGEGKGLTFLHRRQLIISHPSRAQWNSFSSGFSMTAAKGQNLFESPVKIGDWAEGGGRRETNSRALREAVNLGFVDLLLLPNLLEREDGRLGKKPLRFLHGEFRRTPVGRHARHGLEIPVSGNAGWRRVELTHVVSQANLGVGVVDGTLLAKEVAFRAGDFRTIREVSDGGKANSESCSGDVPIMSKEHSPKQQPHSIRSPPKVPN